MALPSVRRRIGAGIAALLPTVALLAASAPAAGAFDAAHPEFGQPHKVTWDRYSVMVDGQRVPIWSGEFHMFRLPSPDLWRDVLEKIKAEGLNTVSLYFNWAYFSPAPGVYDFSGVRDVDRLLTMAQDAGLYVIVRPGPYINAELDSGGFPGWLSTQAGVARTSAPDYTAAWTDYLSHIDPIIARHQITRGGSVIAYQTENELVNTPDKEPYMEAIVNKVRQDGIDVPTTANLVVAPTWEPVVDLDGPDIYPNGFACGSPQSWSSGLSLQIDHMEMNTRFDAPNTPGFLPEFQGGSFDPWAGPGYAACYQLTDGSFQKVLNQTATAQGVTMRNLYMIYGGTSWGWQAVPSDYTSYDYGASIDEARELTPKYYDLKRMAYASAAIAPLANTDAAGKPAGSNSDLLYEERTNPDAHTQFVFLRHSDPTSTAEATTTLSLSTPDGSYPTVPQQPGTAIHVHGRDMKMLIADYALGAQRLVYSTSELMTNVTTGGRDVAVLYGARGDPGETVLRYASQPRVTVLEGQVASSWDPARGDLRLNYTHGGLAQVLIGGGSRDLLLIIDDEPDSGRIWLTPTSAGPVLTYGPYLVRSAQVSAGTLALRGDTSASFPTAPEVGGATGTSAWSEPLDRPASPSPLRVLAGPPVTRVTWNGSPVAVRAGPATDLAGSLPGPPAVSLPALTGWRFAPEAPEAKADFPDSGWTKADHMTTNNVANPPDTLPVLYMDDYGFHYGNVWYRGHFTATGSETGISLDCASGGAPAYCLIWLNGTFLAATAAPGMQTFRFPPQSVRAGHDNVISVLVENLGHPEDFVSADLHKAPRGLRGASLHGSQAPISWLIQGALGGEHPPDMLRGPLNTGGLFGERNGWYLPGFDDSSWTPVTLPNRWTSSEAGLGVGWYRTSFSLDLPAGTDIPIGLRITDDPRFAYGGLIFLNGWMVGQYANDLGPQHLFYLPDGVLNAHGGNVVAIAVMAHGSGGSSGGLGAVALQAYGRYRAAPAPGASPPCQVHLPFTFRVHQNNGRVTRVRIYVDGRRVKTVRGRRIRRVTIAAPGRANFTVRIVAFTVKHKRVVSRRRYHLCGKGRPRTRVHRHRHRRGRARARG